MYYKGYHGDLNETFFVGNVDEKYKKLVKVTWECLDNAIKEGESCLSVFKINECFQGEKNCTC